MKFLAPIIWTLLLVVFGSLLGFFVSLFVGVFVFAGKGYTYNQFANLATITPMFIVPATFYLISMTLRKRRHKFNPQKFSGLD